MQYNKIDGFAAWETGRTTGCESCVWIVTVSCYFSFVSTFKWGWLWNITFLFLNRFLSVFSHLKGRRTRRWLYFGYLSSRGGKYTTWRSQWGKLFGFSIGVHELQSMSYTPSPKAAKPAWAKQQQVPCLAIYIRFHFVYTTTLLTFNNTCNTIKLMDCCVGDRTNDRLWELCLNCDSFLLLFKRGWLWKIKFVFLYRFVSVFSPHIAFGPLRGCRTGRWLYLV